MARSKPRGSRAGNRPAASAPAAQTGKITPAPPSASERSAPRLHRGTLLLVAALLACATLPYVNILFNGFAHDDDFQVVHNPYIRSFQYLKEIFTSQLWAFKGPAPTNYYRPMMTLVCLISYHVFGLRPYGYHLVSLLLHAAVVCVVFALTKRLTKDSGWAFVAGAWFALQPIHTESVAWISAITDIEVTFFFLLTFWLYVAMARPGGKLSMRLAAVMGGTFILALLSKEQAMTLPALATVYEHFYREDRAQTRTSQKLARYGVLWIGAAIYMLFRVHSLGAFAPNKEFGQLTPWQIVLSAMALFGQYVWKLVWPVRLFLFYVFRPSTSPFDLRVLAGLAILLALAALFLVCWRSHEHNVRFASFAILWFLATLAPVLNAHWVGQNVFGERYLYLPSVGAAWLVALGAMKLWRRASARPAQRWALALLGVTVGALYAVRIIIRNGDWKNDVVFYSHSLQVEPEPELFFDLGGALFAEGKLDQAIPQFTEALRLKPDFAGARVNLGRALADEGKIDEAIAQYSAALRIRPDDPGAHLDLGLALAEQGKIVEAIAQYSAALRLQPDFPEAHLGLGLALAAQGRIDQAIAQYSQALRLRPDYPEAQIDLGLALAGQGKFDEAIAQYSAALSLEPDNAEAHNALGAALGGQGKIAEALAQFTEALRILPNYAQAHFNLGVAMAKQGRVDEAIAQYSEALRLQPDFPRARLFLNDLLRRARNSNPAAGSGADR